MLMRRQKQTLAKSQPVNSWNQPSADEVARKMRAQDVAYGQKQARAAGQRRMLAARRK